MITDPLYQDILDGLARNGLDGKVFERTMVGLLGPIFPGIVPVSGGNDAGVDGMIADPADINSESYPLVSTTDKDFMRNLRDSLDKYSKRIGIADRVVFATSQKITPPKRRAVETEIRDRGFRPVQIYEREAVAELLYFSSSSRKSLLGLSGSPAALSVFPPSTRRPERNIPLLGREADLTWLRETSGHRILIGDPGSGKTRLLREWALQSGCLFLASDHEDRIADAIRTILGNEKRPRPALVLDDAHASLDLLSRLPALLQEIGTTEFDLVASTWPMARDEVSMALGAVPTQRIHVLPLLGRQQILEIYQALGLRVADDFLRDLVVQACNRPGLAVTLGILALEGDWMDVLSGKAIRSSRFAGLRQLLNSTEESALAVMSLSDERGMTVEEVADGLGTSIQETHQRLSALAAAGVLVPTRNGRRFRVEPPAMRAAVIGSSFFDRSEPTLEVTRFLNRIPTVSVARSLAHARARRIEVPDKLLRHVLKSAPHTSNDSTAWKHYAQASEPAAEWVLSNYPGATAEIADSLFYRIPEATVRALLRDGEVESDAQLSSLPSHPLRLIREWGRALHLEPGVTTIDRRRLVLTETRRYLSEGGSHTVAYRTACHMLKLKLETLSPDALNRGLNIQWGLPDAKLLGRWEEVWHPAVEIIRITGILVWSWLRESLGDWLNPRLSAPKDYPANEEEAAIRPHSALVLTQLGELAEALPGLRTHLVWFAQIAKPPVPLPFEVNPLFDRLFNRRFLFVGDDLADVATTFCELGAADATQRIRELIAEAESLDTHGYESRLASLGRSLSQRASEIDTWLAALVDGNLHPALVEPILERMREQSPERWPDFVGPLLDQDRYEAIAVISILTHADPPPTLLASTLEHLPRWTAWIETLALRGELSIAVSKFLFEEGTPAVALATASGEWLSDPEGEVRAEVQQSWRQAILRSSDLEFDRIQEGKWLPDILAGTPDLAFDWMIKYIDRRGTGSWHPPDELKQVVSALSDEQLSRLLQALDPGHLFLREWVALLVDGRPGLFAILSHSDGCSDVHLAALTNQELGDRWWELAMMALEAGTAPARIAESTFIHSPPFWGGEEHWSRYREFFSSRLPGSDSSARKLCSAGIEEADRRIALAIERKRQDDLDGR